MVFYCLKHIFFLSPANCDGGVIPSNLVLMKNARLLVFLYRKNKDASLVISKRIEPEGWKWA